MHPKIVQMMTQENLTIKHLGVFIRECLVHSVMVLEENHATVSWF